VARTADGSIWFVTSAGLSVVDPRRFSHSRPSPAIAIERVLANEQPFDPVAEIRLPPRISKLEIDYAALTLSAQSRLRFRHRLEGVDREWVDNGTNRRAVYAHLAPGQYQFRVTGSNDDGSWSDAGLVWSFSVRPALYETSAFYAGCATIVALTIWGAWRLRMRQVRKGFAVVLAERARMSRELHDTLLQSMVATGLQLDNFASELGASSPTLTRKLVRMRRQIEHYICEAHDRIWDLRSPTMERDLSTRLRESGERMTEGTGVEFALTVSGSARPLGSTVEQQLVRIAEEAVTNAIRHARARHVRTDLVYDRRCVRLSISDDGCGFDVDATVRHGDRHWGLTIMRERAEQVGGTLQIVSSSAGGTTIAAVAPLSAAAGAPRV
jgi:signal transduction histidine kinase